MSVNTAEFMRSFDANVKAAKQDYDQTFRAMALQLFSLIITRTPVDEGRLRGNWQVTINSPASGEVNKNDKGGQSTIAKGSRSIASRSGEQSLYFTNNLPYAMTAEFGLWGTGAGATDKTTRDGYSMQAPSGMVRVTLTEFESALRKAASEVRK